MSKALRYVTSVSSDATPVERRKRMLELVASALAITATLALFIVTLFAVLPDSVIIPADYNIISVSAVAMVASSSFVILVNRRTEGDLAGILLVVILIVVISQSDVPWQVTAGRTLFMMAIPIIVAGVTLPPRMTFFAAAMSGTAISIIDVSAGHLPNVPAIAGFFSIALLTWLWGRSLGITLDALRKSEDRYRLLTETAKDVIFSTDTNLCLTYASSSVERVLGWSPQEVVGQSAAKFLTQDSMAVAEEIMRASMEWHGSGMENEYESHPLEVELVRRDGSTLWMELTRGFLRDENGLVNGVVGILRDVSERKLAKRDLEKAVALAEFYTDLMAHDLSNMHQAIMASLELVREEGELSPYVVEMVENALNQTEQCALLVSKVRMHSRIAGDKSPLVEIDPFPPLRAAMELVKNSFPDREIVFNVGFRCGQHLVIADDFLVDLYYNLLHNSVKADRGTIVRLDISAHRTDGGRLELRIDDRGGGIDEATKKWVMSETEDLEYRGRRLGLTLVRQIVERYAGSISMRDRIEGVPTEGTVITIALPAT